MTQPNDVIQQKKDFRPWVVYAFCFVVALVFMFFFGLNSPIHTFNSHCDYQWYMTMGRGWLAGKIPYRDLFEQKGPIVFMVFAVAALFPHPQFVIWCIEVLCISLFLYFCYRIARKFLSPWLSLLVLPLMMAVLSANYVRGLEGSCVEEYCFPIFVYGLLCFLDFIMDDKTGTWRRGLALGICMGILFWVKFTMLEFFLIPLLIWLMTNLVKRRLVSIMRGGLIMLGGLLLVTLPIIIYFGIVGALGDLFNVYFVINIGKYDGSCGDSIHNPWENLSNSWSIGLYFAIVIVWGLLCFVIDQRRQKSWWLLLTAVLPTWLMVGFINGYLYYYLPLFAYAELGIIYAVKVIADTLQKVEIVIQRCHKKVIGLIIAFVITLLIMFPFVTNVAEINRPREAYAPLVVADIIADYNQSSGKTATLFCYRMADCGFYNAAGIVPNVYYYAENSFTKTSFPEMFNSFDATIENQLCDFVITYRDVFDKNQTFLTAYYHPYFENNVEKSTLPFVAYEPGGYEKCKIVILFRNAN